MSAEMLLDRLQKVKKIGYNSWKACCPAHPDRSPSLSIREKEDGLVLVKCFAGCGALDVITAVGLEFPALFPPQGHQERSSSHSRVPARDLLQIISAETTAVMLFAHDMLQGKKPTLEEWQRLAEAAAKIGRARDHIHDR